MSDDLHIETLPDGGIRIQGAGIDLRISEEALERASEEDGLGFNYALTPSEYEMLPPNIDTGEAPIDGLFVIRCMARPHDRE